MKQRRAAFVQRFYRHQYRGRPETIHVAGSLGIETPDGVDRYLDIASSLVDFNARALTIDLRDCTRVWPSGVTLLCSLAKWTDLAAGDRRPRIGSTRPNNVGVERYLQECGFYDFVGVDAIPRNTDQASADLVRIRREITPSSIEEREREIVQMLHAHAGLTNEQIELFDAKVLTEVFNNVTEHGVARTEQGWWIMAQFHPTHRIVSLCIADNGIGIRYSLLTGPQGEKIGSRVGTRAPDDAYIRLALEENVSGAVDAGQRHKPLLRPERYERGSHRGYGLRRIRETCEKLRIPFSLVSQHGFAGINAHGEIERLESRPTRVFAGTLYHFVIPAREV